ncbi:MAG: pyruvate kinase [bacterium]
MKIKLSDHKTKIVCTIGPSSWSPDILKRLINAGMNVARLNLSHGSVKDQIGTLKLIRKTANGLGRTVSIMVDLPGPKLRIGTLKNAPLTLKRHDTIILAPGSVSSTKDIIPVEYRALTSIVSKGSTIYLNDGFIQLKVLDVQKNAVRCQVLVGGVLLSHKGLNIPNIKLDSIAVTAKDLSIVDRFLEYDVDMFSVSFVENGNDIKKIKRHIKHRGEDPVIIAKIERGKAVQQIDEILNEADGIMVARGDLGVEIPIEQVPIVQKTLIQKANKKNKVVITATQMLLSMTEHTRPTRAEVTDVANAILDGTDAVMLSEETAMGKYPVEAVEMMKQIARVTEEQRYKFSQVPRDYIAKGIRDTDEVVAYNVKHTIDATNIKFVITDSNTGNAPYGISRLKPGCWVLSTAHNKKIFHLLNLSYGSYPLLKARMDTPLKIINALHADHHIRTGDKLLIVKEYVNKHKTYSSMDIVTV